MTVHVHISREDASFVSCISMQKICPKKSGGGNLFCLGRSNPAYVSRTRVYYAARTHARLATLHQYLNNCEY